LPAQSNHYAPLERGFGWVQFCLFDDKNATAPVSDMQFRPVVRTEPPHR
jgi:hypothetical protein